MSIQRSSKLLGPHILTVLIPCVLDPVFEQIRLSVMYANGTGQGKVQVPAILKRQLRQLRPARSVFEVVGQIMGMPILASLWTINHATIAPLIVGSGVLTLILLPKSELILPR